MSPEILELRRYVSASAPQVPWGAVLWRLGGKAGAALALTADGRPDPDRVNLAISEAFWLAVGKGWLRPR